MKLSGEIKEYIRLNNRLTDQEIADRIRERFGTNLSAGTIRNFRKKHGLKPGESALTTRMIPKAADTDYIYIRARKILYGYADYDPDDSGETFCIAFMLEKPYYITIGPDKKKCERDLLDKIRQNSRSLGRKRIAER